MSTTQEEIVGALACAGGELLYTDLLEALDGPEAVKFRLDELERAGTVELLDAGAGNRRWRVGWCDCCRADCRVCNMGPLRVRLIP